MTRKRNTENKGLPLRWQHIHGAYYYQVPVGLEPYWDGKRKFRLGRTLPEAYKTWALRIEPENRSANIGQLLDRYMLQVVPTKSVRSQSNNQRYVERIRSAFGKMRMDGLKPQHIYQYVDARTDKVTAKHEVNFLSHALTKAVEWGYIDVHPFKGQVRIKGMKARSRYVEDWEIAECLSLTEVRRGSGLDAVKAYIKLKQLIGLRQRDMLRIRMSDLTDDGIKVKTSKTGKPAIFCWTAGLREAVDEAKAARMVDISPWLFCTRSGTSYVNEDKGTAWAWNSLWQRFMKRVLAETKVKERFTEHDLRAKAGSDAASDEEAQKLLTHADKKTTIRVYRRKPEKIIPLR